MAYRIWQPKATVCPDDREWWGSRPVTCDACGDKARHYLASYVLLRDGPLFLVPYAGLNGGIGREIDAGDVRSWPWGARELDAVYLSECCDAPRVVR